MAVIKGKEPLPAWQAMLSRGVQLQIELLSWGSHKSGFKIGNSTRSCMSCSAGLRLIEKTQW